MNKPPTKDSGFILLRDSIIKECIDDLVKAHNPSRLGDGGKIEQKVQKITRSLLNRNGSIKNLDEFFKSKDLKPMISEILKISESLKDNSNVKKMYKRAQMLHKTKKVRARKLDVYVNKILTFSLKKLLKKPEFSKGITDFLFFKLINEPATKHALVVSIRETLDKGPVEVSDFIYRSINRFLETIPGVTVENLFEKVVKKVPVVKTLSPKPEPVDEQAAEILDDGFQAALQALKDSGATIPEPVGTGPLKWSSPNGVMFASLYKDFYGVSINDNTVKRDKWGRPYTRGPGIKPISKKS